MANIIDLNCSLALLAYPVGSYYWSSVSTSPATLFGGTWEQVKDKFILAAGDTYTAGATGGSATHYHVTSVGGTASDAYLYYGDVNGATAVVGDYSMVSRTSTLSATPVGMNNTTNASSMPPYITAYCWHRIA